MEGNNTTSKKEYERQFFKRGGASYLRDEKTRLYKKSKKLLKKGKIAKFAVLIRNMRRVDWVLAMLDIPDNDKYSKKYDEGWRYKE